MAEVIEIDGRFYMALPVDTGVLSDVSFIDDCPDSAHIFEVLAEEALTEDFMVDTFGDAGMAEEPDLTLQQYEHIFLEGARREQEEQQLQLSATDAGADADADADVDAVSDEGADAGVAGWVLPGVTLAAVTELATIQHAL